MKQKGKSRKIMGALIAAAMCITALPTMPISAVNVGDKLSVGNGTGQHKGNCDGYSYEVWLDASKGGSGSMTLGKGAAFKAEWSAANVSQGNFLARRGLDFDSQKKKATDYPYIGMDYEADYSQTSSGGNSRLCVYGWFRDTGNAPLVEYYIIEDWKNWCPRPEGSSATVTIDGAQYEVFKVMHTGPTIKGTNETFPQYFSVRKSTRTSGHITVSDHFKAWEKQGWGIGTLYEVALNAEGWESSGIADVKMLDVYTDPSQAGTGGDTPSVPAEPSVEYTAPAGSGKGITDDFEGSGTDWTVRGNGVEYGLTKDFVHGGKQSLYVTGRTGAWHGLTASGSELKAGGSYSFDGFVGYKSEEFKSAGFTLGLMYSSGGQTNYDDIVDVTCSAGEWAELKSDFKVPSGATDIALYVQTAYTEDPTAKDLISFFLDDVTLTANGTAAEPGDTPGDTPSHPATGGGVSGHQNNDYTYTEGGDGYKDKMGPYFRIGTSVSGYEITNQQAQEFIKKNFNSITCENEMKPDSICDRSRSSGDNIAISLNSARNILKFAEQNGIGVRGHTFVWYSQTPSWIFRENFQDGGAYVSPERMNKRLESMIKNTFAAIKSEFPNLKLYAYDVCNELFVNDGGGMRPASNSEWVAVYGDDSFVINAFKYARQYAPAECKLYLNDYNEYMPAKTDDLCNIAKKIMAAGDYIDGIGMQSHLASNYPKKDVYGAALEKFFALGLDVQITELDITAEGNVSEQTERFKEVYTLAMENADKISALTVWGTTDERSWRSNGTPLLFSNYQAKDAYKQVIALTDTIAPPSNEEPPTTTEPPVTASVLRGDVDCNGEVELADAVLLAKAVAGASGDSVTTQGRLNGDLNDKSGLDDGDLVLLLQYLGGALSKL